MLYTCYIHTIYIISTSYQQADCVIAGLLLTDCDLLGAVDNCSRTPRAAFPSRLILELTTKRRFGINCQHTP